MIITWSRSLKEMGYNTGMIKCRSEEIRKIVRRRDNHRCFICGAHEDIEKNAISTHHIDGNCENDVVDNVICVCDRCHGMVHRKAEKQIWKSRIEYLMSHR